MLLIVRNKHSIESAPPSLVDRWLPGEKSIVNTRDFPSPKALAEYLHKLNGDDEAYAQYFAWKQKGA